MRIEYLGKVTHGVTISRIEARPGEEYKLLQLFTMQDLSKETGQYGLHVEMQNIKVSNLKFDENLLSRKNLIIIGLTSYKAIVVNDKHINKIVTSNFATIELDNSKINASYFTWYFNEHPNIQKQLRIAMQGTIIKALSVQMLRELDIQVPPLEEQEKIGKLYEFRIRKERATFEKSTLEEKLYKYIMIKKLNKTEEILICK